MKIMSLFLVTLTLILCSCANMTQVATLSPNLQVMPTTEGKGVYVFVNVLDERATKSLGKRGGAYGTGAEIKLSETQDLADIVRAELVAALKAKDFNIASNSSEARAVLKVELRALEYSTSVGIFTGGVHINASLKAIATKNSKVFEKLYRNDDEKRVVVVPGANANEEMLNEALRQLLFSVVNDGELISHLAN